MNGRRRRRERIEKRKDNFLRTLLPTFYESTPIRKHIRLEKEMALY